MNSDQPPKTLTIPRSLPTREEIADLADRDVTVAVAIGQFRAGRVTYEDALRIAVIGLASIAERAIAELTNHDGAKGVVYLTPDCDWPPRQGPTRRQLVGLFMAALSAGIAIGLLAARLMGDLA